MARRLSICVAALVTIRIPLRLSEEAVREIVSNDFSVFAVPHEFPAEQERQIAEVAEIGYADRRVDVHDRF